MNSKEVIVAVCGPGETLGEIDITDGKGHTASVNTLEDSLFLWIAGDDFWQCQERIPLLGRNLSCLLAERLRYATTVNSILATLHLPGKVAYRLLLLADRYGVAQPDGGVLLPMHLSQHEMAGMVGSSRECVNRIFAIFKERGYILVRPKKQLLIRDASALHNYCDDFTPAPANGFSREHNRRRILTLYSVWLQLTFFTFPCLI